MKHIFTLLILSFTTLVFGQWSLKPSVGFNITDASKDTETLVSKGKVGWQFGGTVLIGSKFYVEPGVFYQHQSVEFTHSTDSELNIDHKMTGIRIPVSIGYHLLGAKSTDLNIRIFGGGSGYFVTGSEGDIDKGDITSPQWGVFAGAGVDFWLMFLDLKYEWSVSDITSITQFDVGQSRTFYANLGFRFRF